MNLNYSFLLADFFVWFKRESSFHNATKYRNQEFLILPFIAPIYIELENKLIDL